jgi:hypothetical protein
VSDGVEVAGICGGGAGVAAPCCWVVAHMVVGSMRKFEFKLKHEFEWGQDLE